MLLLVVSGINEEQTGILVGGNVVGMLLVLSLKVNTLVNAE